MKLLVGHDPSVSIAGFEGEGIDLLLTIHDAVEVSDFARRHVRQYDERLEFAVRPGKGRTDRTWGPPSLLEAVPA